MQISSLFMRNFGYFQTLPEEGAIQASPSIAEIVSGFATVVFDMKWSSVALVSTGKYKQALVENLIEGGRAP